ncbi:hypothetical protein V6N12_028527 [Hibiscus sabdariffa]|uniref:Uncharacterized protein n=1 Tax=Hibiscus sabdariffa TaxID=183260 RepID=A0ABR2F639_9ROSI
MTHAFFMSQTDEDSLQPDVVEIRVLRIIKHENRLQSLGDTEESWAGKASRPKLKSATPTGSSNERTRKPNDVAVGVKVKGDSWGRRGVEGEGKSIVTVEGKQERNLLVAVVEAGGGASKDGFEKVVWGGEMGFGERMSHFGVGHDCRYFEWYDDSISYRTKYILRQLRDSERNLVKEIVRLRRELKNCRTNSAGESGSALLDYNDSVQSEPKGNEYIEDVRKDSELINIRKLREKSKLLKK